MNLVSILTAIGMVIGGLGAAVAVSAVLFGRWRRQEDQAKAGYIATLKENNEELRARNVELQELINDLRHRVETLERLVLRNCPYYSEGTSGGCIHCARHLTYGEAR